MEPTRPGKSYGAKLARQLLAEIGGNRDSKLEGANSRHQIYVLADGRVIDFFLKSARVYLSREEFALDQNK